MPWSDPALVALVALALGLAYLNGLHDASNAVSTAIASRALSERTALAVAAALNLLGALLGLLVAAWSLPRAVAVLGLGPLGDVDPQLLGSVRVVVASAVVAALVWGVATWWWQMPSSTWHAMYAGAAGALPVAGLSVPWSLELTAVVLPLLVSPLLGGALAFALVHGLSRLSAVRSVRTHHLRAAQTVSAGVVAAGHGLHDSLLPMAVVALALASAPGGVDPAGAMAWLGPAVAVALAAGTLVGGHRIIRTLARRITDLSTAQGLAAETSAAVILLVGVLGLGVPISTSHTVTAGIVATGAAVGPRSVRWGTVRRILATWLATPPAVAALGAAVAAALTAL